MMEGKFRAFDSNGGKGKEIVGNGHLALLDPSGDLVKIEIRNQRGPDSWHDLGCFGSVDNGDNIRVYNDDSGNVVVTISGVVTTPRTCPG